MNKKQFTVLVIDDEQINVKVLEVILTRNNYYVLTAENGIKGRSLAIKFKPDIILLDIMMPEEDGFETCKKLKDDPITTNIPVIFISALEDVESKIKGLSIGGIDYLTKPFEKNEVLIRVKNYLKLYYNYNRIIEEQAKRLLQIKVAQEEILINPSEIKEANFAIKYEPILEAGGDFYDVFQIAENIFEYFIADISGHDLGASFATSALKALFRQNSSLLYTIEETSGTINKILTSIFKSGQHMTGVYLRLDRTKLTLSVVNAAHLPVIIIPEKGKPYLISANSDIFGAFKNALYKSTNINVNMGDRIILFSDGLIESFGDTPRNREEGIEELIKLCLETSHLSIHESTQNIVEKLFSHGRKPEDDILLLSIKV